MERDAIELYGSIVFSYVSGHEKALLIKTLPEVHSIYTTLLGARHPLLLIYMEAF